MAQEVKNIKKEVVEAIVKKAVKANKLVFDRLDEI